MAGLALILSLSARPLLVSPINRSLHIYVHTNVVT